MRAKRVDSNQKEIVKALREAGAYVFHLHEIGQGCPDLLCGINGITHLIEVKMPNGKFTDAQVKFMKEWTGSKVIRINSPEEAIAFVKSMV